jgi:hypothetical protein
MQKAAFAILLVLANYQVLVVDVFRVPDWGDCHSPLSSGEVWFARFY